jgi:hypothetical protein
LSFHQSLSAFFRPKHIILHRNLVQPRVAASKINPTIFKFLWFINLARSGYLMAKGSETNHRTRIPDSVFHKFIFRAFRVFCRQKTVSKRLPKI